MSALPVYLCICMCMCFFKGGVETWRRLITSSSFAVGWLHLDGPVHLEREGSRGKGRKKEKKGNPRLAGKKIRATATIC